MRENLALARVARAILAQRSPQTRLFQTLFDRQQAFISDPAEFAVACCSRQAGKTRSCATAMIMKANEAPERNVAYVALTRKSAKLICWRTLKSLCKQFGLKPDFNESELIVNFANGSIIQLTGANDSAVGETLRGLPWDLAIVDEAASFRGHIQDVIDECIAPSFITRHGKLKLIGTPSSDFQSYFYQAFHSLPDYSRHHWTVRNNPHIPHADEYLAKLLVRKGWDVTNPTYLREYEGKWARSTDNLVYHAYNPLRNQCTMEAVPQGLMTVMGVDLGWNDANAVVVLGYNPQLTRKVYVLHQRKKSHELISDLGAHLAAMQDFYKPVAEVCDEGGLGKAIAEELNYRFNLHLKPAQKQHKLGFIELVNSALAAGDLMIVDEERGLAEEYMDLPWKDDAHTMEDPKHENHLCVAQGTLVLTNRGNIPIETVTTNDFAWTRMGWRRILHVWNNGLSQTVEIVASNGSILRCTQNHPIYNMDTGKFVRADALTYASRMEAVRWSGRNSTELHFIGIQNQGFQSLADTFIGYCKSMAKKLWFGCIDMCGSFITALSRPGIISTTKTETRQITQSTTLSVWTRILTGKSIAKRESSIRVPKMCLHILRKYATSLRNGMLARRDTSGTRDMRNVSCVKGSHKSTSASVRSAVSLTCGQSMQLVISSFVPTSARQNRDVLKEKITSGGYVSGAKINSALAVFPFRTYAAEVVAVREQSIERVWNLEVDEAHEYYANGILVHNCDATTYAWRECTSYLYDRREPDAPRIAHTSTKWDDYGDNDLTTSEWGDWGV